jgi:hypothetical protein
MVAATDAKDDAAAGEDVSGSMSVAMASALLSAVTRWAFE